MTGALLRPLTYDLRDGMQTIIFKLIVIIFYFLINIHVFKGENHSIKKCNQLFLKDYFLFQHAPFDCAMDHQTFSRRTDIKAVIIRESLVGSDIFSYFVYSLQP